MARFDRSIATAERLIARNGQAVKWRVVKSAAGAVPWKPGQAADEDKDVVVCFLPMDKENKQFLRYLRGTNDVPTGYLIGLMKGNIDFVPAIADVIVRDTEVLRIRSIDLLSPNGQKVLYTMELEA